MAVKFIGEEGELKGSVLAFQEGQEWIVGRDPDLSQMIVQDAAASRRHLRVVMLESGALVENLSSTNPILVNDKEITGEVLLKNGDSIKIGNTLYRVNDEASQEEVEMANTQENNQETPSELPPEVHFDDQAPSGKDALADINYDMIDTGRWLLKVIGGPNNGAEYAMQAGNAYTIGTDPNTCDVVFHDTSVSRQHARITVGDDDKLSVEDLKSRNGTLVDGEPLKTKKSLAPNIVVSVGTSSFIIYDREGEMQTIISPLLPSIVKVLQKEEVKAAPPEKTAEEIAAVKREEAERRATETRAAAEKASHNFSKFLISAILTGLVLVVGIGTATLFKAEPVVKENTIDYNQVLSDALAPFPSIKWSFSPTTGRLLLIGHVLTANDRNQLLYNLEGLRFVRNIDDSGLIIDEGVWQEINQLLANNNSWKGITVQATSPGKFVLTGYLQTRKQAEQLYQYMSENFRYLDSLDRKVVVDEDVIQQASIALSDLGIKNLAVQMSNGELTVSGNLPAASENKFDAAVAQLRAIPGVRLLRNYITALPPEATLINISDKYAVTGYSDLGNGNISVVINGRILSRGDSLDGMTITAIQPNAILLIKDNVRYRIDYSK